MAEIVKAEVVGVNHGRRTVKEAYTIWEVWVLNNQGFWDVEETCESEAGAMKALGEWRVPGIVLRIDFPRMEY